MRIYAILPAAALAVSCASTDAPSSSDSASYDSQSVNADRCIEKVTATGLTTACPTKITLDTKRPYAYDDPYYCKVKFDVTREGKVRNASLVSSSGFKNLSRLCITSFAKWTFAPPTNANGEVTEAKDLLASVQFIHDKDFSKKDRIYKTPYLVYINFEPVADRLKKPETYHKAIRVNFPKPKKGKIGTFVG